MKNFFIAGLFMVLSVVSYSQVASSVQESIEIHRKWMARNYPEADDGALLKEAAMAVYYGLREPEAKKLLRFASKDVPQLGDYVAWIERDEPDYLFKYTLAALGGIADSAIDKLGVTDINTQWCRFFFVDKLSIMENVGALSDEMIDDQAQLCNVSPDREAKALLCIMKLCDISDWSLREQEYPLLDPKEYINIIRLEKEAIRVYPIDDSSVDFTRAILYQVIANAKAGLTSEFVANYFQYKEGYISETRYEVTGNGVLLNSSFYYDKALNYFAQIFSEGHPAYVSCFSAECDYIQNSFPCGEEYVMARLSLLQYVESYYPKGSCEQVTAQYALVFAKLLADYNDIEEDQCFNLSNNIASILGEGNLLYRCFLSGLVVVAGSYNMPGYSDMLDNYCSLVTKYANDGIARAMWEYSVFAWLRDYCGIDAEKELYLNLHKGDYLSIELGRSLVSYYTKSYDWMEALKLQQAICEDATIYYGANSPITFHEESDAVEIMSYVDMEEGRKQYKALIENMERHGVDYTGTLSRYAYFEYATGNYGVAEKLYKQLIRLESEEDNLSVRVQNRLFLVDIMGQNNGNENRRESVFQEAVEMMRRDSDTLNYIVHNYVLASKYLFEKCSYQDALKYLDDGLNIQSGQTGGKFDQDYVNLICAKLECLGSIGDINEGSLLVSSLMEWDAGHENTLYSNSTLFLDVLWKCYDFLEAYSQRFFMKRSVINKITAITLEIYKRNNADATFMTSYFLRWLCNVVNVSANMKAQRQSAPGVSEELREMWNQYSMWNEIDGFAVSELPEIVENVIPSYDANYKDSDYYKMGIYALFQVYKYIHPDKYKAKKYLWQYCELSQNDPAAAFSGYIELANYSLSRGDKTEYVWSIQCAEAAFLKLPAGYQKDKAAAALASIEFNRSLKNADYDRMLECARGKFSQSRKVLESASFELMTEDAQNAVMNSVGYFADGLCYVLENKKEEISGEVYDAVLYETGMQLRSLAKRRESILESGNVELVGMLDSLDRLRGNALSLSIMYKLDQKQEQEYDKIGKLEVKIYALETSIMEAYESIRPDTEEDVTWETIRDGLGKDEAAIEFVYSENDILAMVVRPGYDAPKVVPLVSHQFLMQKLSALGIKTTDKLAKKLYEDKAIDLYAMLWQPLEKNLDGVKTVYYSTPGILNNLSFDAFSTPDGTWLMDKVELCRLTTTAQILHPVKQTRPGSALLIGDVVYSENQKSGKKADTKGSASLIDGFEGLSGMKSLPFDAATHFPYLGGEEMEVVKQAFGDGGISDGKLVLRRGEEASEQEFKNMVEGHPDLIHLDTHGFYIASYTDALKVPFYANHSQLAGNSMSMSGVALYGAEATWCGIEADSENDGILTAEELSRLELYGTKLVTISACESALGDYSCEGVYGLSRGLKIAGASSILVSLWRVDSAATSLMMSEFYNNWLKGKSLRVSMRKAVDVVREQYPSPYYWASFVLLDAN